MKKLIFTLVILAFVSSVRAQWVKKANGLDTTKSLNGFVQLGTNIYAGYYGGVFLSTNNGDSWSSVSVGLNDNRVLALAGSGNNLYAGTYGGGVYRSTNSGATWSLSGLNGNRVWSLCVYGTKVYAGTEWSGLYVTSDSGATWGSGGLSTGFIFGIACKDNNIFTGTRSGLYRTTNNGIIWSNVLFNGIDIGPVAINGQYIFAGESGGSGVYVSTNNGSNWFVSNSGMTHYSVYCYELRDNYIFAGTQGGGVYLSSNNGANWIQKMEGMPLGTTVGKLLTTENYIFAGTSAGSLVWRRPLTDLMIPSAPVLIEPANNSIGQLLSLNLVWNKTKYSTKYRVLLATDSLFTNVILNDSLLTDSLKSLTNLNTLTNYYWKISAGNNAGWSSYSSFYKFKTIGNPTQVVLNIPVNNSVNQPVNTTFKWYKAIDQTIKTNKAVSNYWLEYSADSAFVTGVVKDSTLTDTTKSVSGLSNLAKYYWRVKAKNQTGWGGFSSVWNFTTVPPIPLAPALIAPSNNATNQAPNLLLDWGNVVNAAGYRVQIATDSLFTSTVFDTSNVNGDSLRVRPGLLIVNTKYFWRVNAVNVSGTGPWSTVWNFTTVPAIPLAPALIAPPNNATNQAPNLLLDWGNVVNAASYRVQIATDSLFTSTVFDTSNVNRDSLRVRSGLLLANIKYFWRVNATNVSGTGPWSSVWNFRINPTGLSISGNEIPNEFKLYTNYPNPFNSSSKFKFEIAKLGNAKIVVFDLMGREVATLVNEQLAPGTYEATFDGSNLSSGTYFYKLTSGDFSATKRLTLLK